MASVSDPPRRRARGRPPSPRLSGRIVFLTDSRAISYAESVMGYVRDCKLATIVGATTAGTNGNVIAFDVPSGLAIWFTGMKVTRHDGSSPFRRRFRVLNLDLENKPGGPRSFRRLHLLIRKNNPDRATLAKKLLGVPKVKITNGRESAPPEPIGQK